MKKWLSIILCTVMWSLFATAAVAEITLQDEIPQDVLAMERLDNPEATFTDCLRIEGTPLGDYCFVLSSWHMNGYLLKDGAWQLSAQVMPMPQENHAHLFFRRHIQGSSPQNALPTVFDDDLGFDIIRSDSLEMTADADIIQYHWLDGDFRVVGWQSKDSDAYAAYEEGQWVFYNRSTGARLGSVQLDHLYEYGLLQGFHDLPHTLVQAQAMEAITQPAVQALFPGWILSFYEEYNGGHGASAGYFRIEDGLLTLRRVVFSSQNGVDWQSDTMPVPLSTSLLAQLQTGDADTYIDTSGYGDTFLTEDAFDRERIPVAGKVLASDMQASGLLLLTEDDNGTRHVVWVEAAEDGYRIRTSNPLPHDAYFDLFHCGDDEVLVQWDGQGKSCGFSRTVDGNWPLQWVMSNAEEGGVFSTPFCGIAREGLNTLDGITIGSLPCRDLFSVDFFQLPDSSEEAIAQMSRDGWAVVCNPVETDRLHLRTGPDRTSTSLGKFYNRTPVTVLEQKGDWSRVQVGLDGHLEGWMLTKFLAFGTEMEKVTAAMPMKFLQDDHAKQPLYTSISMKETSPVTLSSHSYWIIGVVDDALFILLDAYGNTGYLPQEWFWDGNG